MRKNLLLQGSRLAVVAAGGLMLASCGEDGGSGAVSVVSAPAPAASASPTAAATAAPPPGTAVAAAPSELQLYSIGGLTWSLDTDVSEDIRARITDSMNWTINHTNTLAGHTGHVSVTYHVGTPTAEAGYRWRIQFGGSIGRRVALHELAHWLGSGTAGAWGSYMWGGQWRGDIGNARIRALDGPDAVMWGDRIHFWPYGLNYDSEFFETQRNVQLVSAQLGDMGLGDPATQFAGDRRFVNRSSQLLLNGTGTAPTADSGTATSLTWRVAYKDGYIILANAANGLAVDSMGNTGNGDGTSLAAASDSANQQWEVIPTDEGWFLLRNRQTRKCLDNAGNLGGGAPIRVWDCGSHPNQQWHLVR